jgi:hypothetical protein
MRVVADIRDYRIAAAELPVSVALTTDPAEALVVVAGRHDWADVAARAAEAGARAVLLDRPRSVDAAGLQRLADRGLPALVSRPRLRGDALADALDARGPDAPALLTASCAAPASELRSVVRDVIGWLRILGGGPVSLEETGAGTAGAVALLDAGGVVATLVVAIRDVGAHPLIRLLAHGARRVEVEVSDSDTSVVACDEEGSTKAAVHYEDAARAVLRRAAAGETSTDLADLAADAAVADAVVSGLRAP